MIETTVQHTPGPWQVAGGEVWAGTKRITMGRGSYDVKDAEERRANARLIAAAPALLEACEQLLKYSQCMPGCRAIDGDGPCDCGSHAADTAARAAIAAARGPQQ